MDQQRPEADETRAAHGARRILHVLGLPRERPRRGLMQQEFHRAFRSDGWTMEDFRAASIYAYQAGWITLDGHLYCMTERGAEQLRESKEARQEPQ